MIRRNVIALFFCFLYSVTFSQVLTDKLVKYHEPEVFWLNLRYDHFLESGSYIYFDNTTSWGHSPAIGNSFPFNKVYRMHFRAGFEYKAGEHWYLGLSEKVILLPVRNAYTTRLNISHRGRLWKLKFVKEAAFEYYKYPKSYNPNIIVQNEGALTMAASLVKDFSIADRKLYLLCSYRPYVYFDFVSDGFSSYDKRLIDQTMLRLEADYFLTDRFLVSLFFIKQTIYSYQLATYSGSSPTVQIAPEARTNRITPAFGISLNYVFNAPEDFLPGFPDK